MEDISKVRQNIYLLNKKRSTLLEKVMSPGKLLSASFYIRYTKCGSPNCKCAAGQPHGPFPWIYQNRKGQKLVSTSCRQDKVEDASLFSENYTAFKENYSQIRKLDEEIGNLIMKIETLSEVNVTEFTRKDGEKRGRKQKKSKPGTE
jgi:hypothetical protein